MKGLINSPTLYIITTYLINLVLGPTGIDPRTAMACSLEQFENLIAKQSECLAKQRLQERSEDLIKFSDMIKSNVRTEVREVVQPLTKRQEAFEASTTKQFEDIT